MTSAPRWFYGGCWVLALAACHACAGDAWLSDPILDQARSATGTEALALYQKLVEKYADAGGLHAEAGMTSYDENQYELALTRYLRAAELGWKPDRVHVRIGKCYEKLKRYREAEAAFRKALLADGGSVAATFGLGSALFYQELPAGALPHFEALAGRDDEWGGYAREFLANCYFDVGRFRNAAELTRKLLQAQPNDATLRWLLARSLYKAGAYAEAEPLFNAIIAEDPKRAVSARFYLGVTQEFQGRTRDAEETYRQIYSDDSEWGREARRAVRGIAGKDWRVFLDYSAGYDSNVLQTPDTNVATGLGDGFNQAFFQVEGRVLRSESFSIWLGAEHYSIQYPDLHNNDYIEETVRASFHVPGLGPFHKFVLNYQLSYALFDYKSYRKQHRGSVVAFNDNGANHWRITAAFGDNRYYESAKALTGSEVFGMIDYRRDLPLWEHSVRARLSTEYRWTDSSSLDRLSQKLRVQYRATLAKNVFGFVEGGVRRDDFFKSDNAGLRRRTDLRLSAEVGVEFQIRTNLSINANYLHERQSSSRETLEYTRHQGSLGFSLSF